MNGFFLAVAFSRRQRKARLFYGKPSETGRGKRRMLARLRIRQKNEKKLKNRAIFLRWGIEKIKRI